MRTPSSQRCIEKKRKEMETIQIFRILMKNNWSRQITEKEKDKSNSINKTLLVRCLIRAMFKLNLMVSLPL